MREHVRGNGRYFRTEAGKLTLDWGGNGGDYRTLDFSYVAKSKGGLRKIYGQVCRNVDGETYDTYDIMAGRKRRKTSKNSTVENAIKAHIKAETGDEAKRLDVKGKMPYVPNTIRKEMKEVMLEAVEGWNECLPGEGKEMTAAEKIQVWEMFVVKVWMFDYRKFFCDSLASKGSVKAVGLLNVDVGRYGALYEQWREYCASLGKEQIYIC